MDPTAPYNPLPTSVSEKALLERQQHEPQGHGVDCYSPEPMMQLAREDRSRRRRRFLKGFGAGVLLFFALKMFAGSVSSYAGFYTRGGCNDHHQLIQEPDWLGEYDEHSVGEPGEFPIPPDMTVDHCTNWPDEEPSYLDGDDKPNHDHDDHYHSVWNTFELPISSKSLFLLSRGPFSFGAVDIGQSDQPGDSVLVNVTTHYRHPHLLEHAQVCQLNRHEGEVGVGVFSTRPPRRGPHRHRHIPVWFGINVTLPKGTEESPLELKTFATSMGIFPQTIGDLTKTVRFENLFLKSAVSGISAKTVWAKNMVAKTSAAPIQGIFGASSSLKLVTSNSGIHALGISLGESTIKSANGPIIGTYTASTRLDLITANAPIDVNVTLFNKDEDTPTEVKMETAHGRVNGNLTLYKIHSDKEEDSASNPGGSFKISASNAVGPISLLTSRAPVNSTINLKAKTALGPVQVQMHPTFEGRFSVQTTMGKNEVTVDEEQEDPDKKGRKRSVDFSKAGSATIGKVYWGDANNLRGEVKLETTLASAELKL
ncbi:hypothetical protein VKT23_018114 [Stygiomarasmius scandens]|uniref:DUF7330 domain-containing protein n=1 Tax=Marasmiellus scandens TaxID=2682957 RepID=A0ABR1IS32_9AGAR